MVQCMTKVLRVSLSSEPESTEPESTEPSNGGPLSTIVVDRDVHLVDAFSLAHSMATAGAVPGTGDTLDFFEALASIASADLGVVRAIEPHLDAVAILGQAGLDAPQGSWGVFAAEGGDDPLTATKTETGWRLSGTKPWCSLANRLDNALVTAHTGAGTRSLFSVRLRDEGVDVIEGAWHARGLAEIPSGPVHFDDVKGDPVGEPGWYLSRPGFAWGGIGVAACWFGGAVGIARTVFAAAAREGSSPFVLMHLGAIDTAIEGARRALAEAAALIDAGAASDSSASLLAKRVRSTVAQSVETVIVRAGRALGPAPLALDAEHAKRVSDLELYVRQHHAERDEASLGTALVSRGSLPW
jgi:alkylation response protein AidB-like acyl-CoA dehydrogenase